MYFFDDILEGLKDSKKSGRVLEIIQTGDEIISPTSRPKIKNLILRNVSHLIQGGSKMI